MFLELTRLKRKWKDFGAINEKIEKRSPGTRLRFFKKGDTMKRKKKTDNIPSFTINGENGDSTEYKVSEMSPENQEKYSHIVSLSTKAEQARFNYVESQVAFRSGLETYRQELVKSLQNGEAEKN